MWKRVGMIVSEVALIVAAAALIVAMLAPVKVGASPEARNRDALGLPIRDR